MILKYNIQCEPTENLTDFLERAEKDKKNLSTKWNQDNREPAGLFSSSDRVCPPLYSWSNRIRICYYEEDGDAIIEIIDRKILEPGKGASFESKDPILHQRSHAEVWRRPRSQSVSGKEAVSGPFRACSLAQLIDCNTLRSRRPAIAGVLPRLVYGKSTWCSVVFDRGSWARI